MSSAEPHVLLSELHDRGVYEIYSRNLLRGVYREALRDFIGIRYKFGSHYLFSEVLNDPPGRGTVTRIYRFLCDVPAEVELIEGHFVETPEGKRYVTNGALFALLRELDEPSITCPVCGMTSYNENDIRAGYCGNCHQHTTPRP